MDEAKRMEVHAWYKKAEQDLEATNRLLKGPMPLCDAAGFHCQQAAEKALKAFLTWKDIPFIKTHSLVALVAACLSVDPEFEQIREAAVTLTPYAVASRYPGDLAELTQTEAQTALVLANHIWNFVNERLPQDLLRES
ncbi:MAG: HEPN domain-containing protein [Anaerolineae bacterium]